MASDIPELQARIRRLKDEINAVILAHNYQRPEVQDVADFVGDSFGLSRQATQVERDIIVFCGVHFMAESAKILNPEKTVLLPDYRAGCPMADMVTPQDVRALRREHPNAAVVAYINTSAAVKAESDICCTSANAVKVVDSLPQGEVIFIPDENLGRWVAAQTRKKVILFEGYCRTHKRLTKEQVLKMKAEHPQAKVIIHPECITEVAEVADAVLSTTGMINYVHDNPAREFIVGTEIGVLHRMQKENPAKTFYAAAPYMICPNMKMTTLESVAESMEKRQYVIEVPETIRLRARRTLERMLEVGK